MAAAFREIEVQEPPSSSLNRMVVLNKIYTRTGDDGTTALGTGARVRKDAIRVAAYGTVDETNATIGLARVQLGDSHSSLDGKLSRIQNDLFDLGADLCVPDRGAPLPYEPLRISSAQVKRLESEIDEMNADLKPLRSFVLPGGSPAAAALHVARTVCRRAERLIVELAAEPNEPVSDAAMQYINRLSDFLLVAARFANGRGKNDVLWVPGQNR
jgi:cob(I)alamin adenosyltransferase